jgi:hypothetical protein
MNTLPRSARFKSSLVRSRGLDIGAQTAEEVVHHCFDQGECCFIDLYLEIAEYRFGEFTVSEVYRATTIRPRYAQTRQHATVAPFRYVR